MSKELEALTNLMDDVNQCVNSGGIHYIDNRNYDIVEKGLKALEIIKEKNFDLFYLQDSKDLEMYNDVCDHYRNLCYLTQEEYDLLKEVLL